ncbi:Methyltransferase type 12 [Beutenbergia cavernae DSM 12333]|uniref:Methyltransferase type 12 n=1 Tax=Beutenbergia cavernae (strain ATCC BAA-8 / DSM 12333 / CCUG 43141 / JCM 11478 / NBRC 16432 / NCIMB 13614 / HKI 0122) TaxID=471853 RepID=C5C2N6_BEUC1|nr:class I SAM-dependent methyltransferase [Beutenbergia cavernae]ACQ79722.1 Methyltransferase type 12 [Beutenbergia cavernae DSM 12333]
MPEKLSRRLADAVAALPLEPGMRVLEIGCGPGAAARALARIVAPGTVVAIDRSAAAVRLARAGSAAEIEAGTLDVRQSSVEDFRLDDGEAPFDLAFGLRIGALDGRHPEAFDVAMSALAAALSPTGRVFVDGGDPLRELPVPRA